MSNFSATTSKNINFRLYGWEPSEDRPKPVVFFGMSFNPLSADTTMTPDEARHLSRLLIMAADEAEGKDEKITRQEIIYSLLAASGPQDLGQIKRELQTQLGDYADPAQTLAALVAHGMIAACEEPNTWEAIE